MPRYCGEYYDAETGTIYLRARYYNPTTGRFISRDSFAGRKSDPLSLNLYTYCRNNPLIYIDPSGHSYATLPDGTTMDINSNWDAQQFYKIQQEQLSSSNALSNSKNTENNDKNSNSSTATISALNPDTPTMKQIGTAYDYTNSINRNIWILEARFENVFLNEFNTNDDFNNDILIIDRTNSEEINYTVYNSYLYSDRRLIDETVSIINDYNEGLGRTEWNRSVDGLRFEWYEHNAFYALSYIPFLSSLRDVAMHADLDNHAKGTPFNTNLWQLYGE